MATINPYKRFKKLIGGKPRIRAQIVALDASLQRVKVQYSSGSEWVNGSGSVGEFVMVEGDQVVGKLPNLPYQRIEVE